MTWEQGREGRHVDHVMTGTISAQHEVDEVQQINATSTQELNGRDDPQVHEDEEELLGRGHR